MQFAHCVRVNMHVCLGGQMGGAAGMMRGLNIPGTPYCVTELLLLLQGSVLSPPVLSSAVFTACSVVYQ
jgi:hypothetical protein